LALRARKLQRTSGGGVEAGSWRARPRVGVGAGCGCWPGWAKQATGCYAGWAKALAGQREEWQAGWRGRLAGPADAGWAKGRGARLGSYSLLGLSSKEGKRGGLLGRAKA